MNKTQRDGYLTDLSGRLRVPLVHQDLIFTSQCELRSPRSVGPEVARRFLAESGDRWESALAAKLAGFFVPDPVGHNPKVPHEYVAEDFDGRDLDHLKSKGRRLSVVGWQNGVDWWTGSPYRYRPAPDITLPHHWLRLFTGRYALGTNWDVGDSRTSLFFHIATPRGSLLDETANSRKAIIDVLRGTWVHIFEKLRIVEPTAHWMASGGEGIWMHVFLDKPIHVAVLKHVLAKYKSRLEYTTRGFQTSVKISNLRSVACPVPFSRHDRTGRYACYLDPSTGEPFEDQCEYIMGIGETRSARVVDFTEKTNPELSKKHCEEEPTVFDLLFGSGAEASAEASAEQ